MINEFSLDLFCVKLNVNTYNKKTAGATNTHGHIIDCPQKGAAQELVRMISQHGKLKGGHFFFR